MDDAQGPHMPAAERQYLDDVIMRLRDRLGDALVGVYLFGSAASGAYEPGTSDLDVQAVVRRSLDAATLRAVAHDLAHTVLPCPARRLEFVVYEQRAVDPASRHPRFMLNYNTGSDIADRVVLDPGEEASHWFLLDIAMGRTVGQTLYGADLRMVFAPIPRLWQLEAIADSLRWHQQHEAASANSVLNAVRGWRYAVTGELGSKQAGAKWALQQPNCPPAVPQAVAQRAHGASIDATDAHALVAHIVAVVQNAIAMERRMTNDR